MKINWNLKDHTKSKVIDIGYAVRNFNLDNNEKPIKLFLDENDNWSENLSEIEIPFLSFYMHELLLITIQPNEEGWFEAYSASDKERKVSISHIDFVSFLNIK